jgi:hypothetical protein
MPPLRLLRRSWLGFCVLITLGLVRELVLFTALHPWHYAYMAGHAALFGLMVVATYWQHKLLWWLVIFTLSIKLYRLLKYYALFDYESSSIQYNHDYLSIFHSLQYVSPWFMFAADIPFGNHALSAAFLTTLYVYWLVQCRKLLHTPPTGTCYPS